MTAPPIALIRTSLTMGDDVSAGRPPVSLECRRPHGWCGAILAPANEIVRKVVRGGSWRDRPKNCRSSFRLAYPPWQQVFNVGFRVVLEQAEKTTAAAR